MQAKVGNTIARPLSAAESMPERPRVLHIVGSLALGGIETWLMHMLRQTPQFHVRHELLLLKQSAGPYEPEVERLGIPIHRLVLKDGKLNWPQRFGQFLSKNGPYLAVQSHCTPYFNATALLVARMAGVPLRIAHSHEARTRGVDCPPKQKIGTWIARPILEVAANRRIGISEASIEEIAGTGWRKRKGTSVLHYGFDFSRYRDAEKRATALRARLGVPPDAKIVGTVARFDPVKNHSFLIEAFDLCCRQVPEAHLVLVGEGRLRTDVEEQVARLGLRDRVHFAGATQDIPAYMALFDLFTLPSHSEGLGIVCVEAQAAGTRSLVSTGFPQEAFVVPGAVDVLPLTAGVERWASAMAAALTKSAPDAAEWLRVVEKSRFGLERCVRELDAIYASAAR